MVNNFLRKLLSGGGVKVPHYKETSNCATEAIPLPEKIVLPMSQHVGAPCEVIVNKGDHVDVGTMVGKAPSKISMHIFSSVSGTVSSIEPILYNYGKTDRVVIIKPDGAQTPDPSIKPPVIESREDFLNALEMSGIVGLGGAGFPTDIKVAPKNLSEIDTLIINGAECEPYITTDNREFIECSDSVIFGIHECLKWLGIPKALICIEDNKPEAIELMRQLTKEDEAIDVKVLESIYPQGAQNILIKNATGRIVPRGARHTVVGVLVLNVTTVSSIGKFIKTGMPLVTKRVTVAGDAVLRPGNLEVPIGTPIEDLIDYCGTKAEPTKVIIGGPMMGQSQMGVEFPILRANNGLLLFSKNKTRKLDVLPCIKCGRCINSCPMGLSPVDIHDAYYDHDADMLDKLMADLCVGCGTCSYVCPSKRQLTPTVTLAKTFLKKEQSKRES